MADVAVRPSKIAGRGIFATRDFKKRELIFSVRGPIIKYDFPPDWRIGQDRLNVGRNIWKIAYRDNPWNFINHSCAPNAGLRGSVSILALRNIKKGDEITIDYSWTESDDQWRMKCACAESSCRKIVRSVQYLPEKIFNKYKEYIPAFLRNEYLKRSYYVDKIKDDGRGIFAKRKITKGERIFSVIGPAIKYSRDPNYKIGYKWLGVAQKTWIIPSRNNPWNSIRHSCNPNVGMRGATAVVAMRTILPSEELTIDDSMIEADYNWERKCRCGGKNCRGVVRSVQFLSKDLFKKYKPYIPLFFQKVFQDANK